MAKIYKPKSLQELKELVNDKSVHLGDIDTSLITDMTELFKDSKRKNFDGLETWDTSNVTTMKGMFYRAKYFNHPIGDWDVSKVEDMTFMFCEAPAFNQPLEKWNVSNVRCMNSMFAWAYSFNQPIERWDVSNVYNMKAMLYFAKSFNQPLNNWNVSKVYTITCILGGAKSFNQPLDKWNVSKVKDMTCMFYGATSFRQPITAWKLRGQSTRDIFLDLPDYRDMESRVMCLAALDGNNREYELQEMIEILGEKEVQDALRLYGAKYGLNEYLQK